MSELHFAEPQWIHLLWAVLALVALLAWLERRSGGDLGRFIGVALHQRLVVRTSPLRRSLRLFFLALCGGFLTLALMRPQWGVQFVSTPQVGAEIMVCLDVSRSMLAEDVAPNRLERAKAELRDLLAYLDGDQVGLIAFAGRATVLSPLTPDFGFLRLVLDEAGPQSVTRGGTRLEEPIRKALAGFKGQGGERGEVSRSILLITDGEDHDSFPLEAAKEAAKRGIRILSIGFGDEAGSEIVVTDAETGARTLLRDADGRAVKSRLDGELLREMALLTEGAYIPAGTGVLDLESIYDRHIAGLTRGRLDSRGHTVRNDAFQWAVLFALVCLLAAVASPSIGARPGSRLGGMRSPLAVLLVGALVIGLTGALTPTGTRAEESAALDGEPATLEPAPASGDATGDGEAAPEDAPDPPSDPRTAYNQGLAQLRAGELEAAAVRFEETRTEAGADGEARFRATYNLGWLEVERADTLLESEPQNALQALYRAADWFREAISLRPKHTASRHNLEVVLSRALALADHLAKRDGQDLETRLQQLIEQQRGFLAELGQGVDLAALDQDPNAAGSVRRSLRAFSSRQLELLSEAERFSESAGQELSGLQAKPEAERSAEEAMRLAQLAQLLQHVHRAREYMGQTRGQLRRLQAERAYRRAAGALSALKRAADQLLDPVARLDLLLRDGMELLRQTGQKGALSALAAQQNQQGLTWLTSNYLSEAQDVLAVRTGELHQGLSAGLAQAQETPAEAGASAPEQAQLLRRLEAAEPLIAAGHRAFLEAQGELEADRVGEALEPQQRGISNMAAAREHFLDLRRLVELLYQDERRVANFLEPPEEDPEAAIQEYVPVALELQSQNQERLQRVTESIIEELVAVLDAQEAAQAQPATGAVAAQGPASGQPDPAALQAEQQRLEQADALRVEAERAMAQAVEDLKSLEQVAAEAEAVSAPLQQARQSVALTLTHLESLRRLFFSVIDHLQETLRRQIDLGDRTEESAVLAETETTEEIARRLGPLSPEQGSLAEMTGTIAEALRQQAEQPKAAPPGGQASSEQDAALAQRQRERLDQAAEHVASAQPQMEQAAERMTEEPPPFETIRDSQQQAVEELSQALALLQPPQPQPNEQDRQDQHDQQGEQQQPQESEQGEEGAQPQPAPTDLGQLLQGVRDREAQRREQRAQQQRQRYEPVEKDW
jgi:Ca-activated chloride channel family protein